jgi:hypothetical protein
VLRHAPLFSPFKSFAVNAHFIVVILSEREPSLRGERESKDLAFLQSSNLGTNLSYLSSKNGGT